MMGLEGVILLTFFSIGPLLKPQNLAENRPKKQLNHLKKLWENANFVI